VAIVQISRIQQRKGLQDDLPQLAGGELGWSVDQRRLFIGNGTLTEGAPAIGNTEVLTEFSNLLGLATAYTYQGEAGGYTVQTGETTNAPVSQSLQSRLDSFAVITDFGAIGDGVTDNTDAINRAMYEIYCRQSNPQIRRGIFFPAGVYLITESILVPPYAYLYGEGDYASVIKLDLASDVSTLNAYVARTCDALFQYGPNIGVGGAAPPQSIHIANMGFESLQETDVFLVDQATDISFTNVSFTGPLNQTELSNVLTRGDIAGIRFNSTSNLVVNNITFDNCMFTNTTYGLATGEQSRAIHVTNSYFNNLYQGIYLGGPTVVPAVGGPTGCAILHNSFDSIYAEGVFFSGVTGNMTGFNYFYDVGNHFGGPTGTGFSACILIEDANNVCVGDMFTRSDSSALTAPRIDFAGQPNIGIDNGKTLLLGSYQRDAGYTVTLPNNSISAILFNIDSSEASTFQVNYSFVRGTSARYGVIEVITTPTVTWTEEYTESSPTGLTITVTQFTSIITVRYTTTNTGVGGLMRYSVVKLR